MVCTAYTPNDAGMDGKGITASGVKAVEGVTVAVDPSIPYGTQIYIPALDKLLTVQDRGGAIKGNRLDLYMEDRNKALDFGVQYLEIIIRY